MGEEQRYYVWSTYFESGLTHLSYEAFCDTTYGPPED